MQSDESENTAPRHEQTNTNPTAEKLNAANNKKCNEELDEILKEQDESIEKAKIHRTETEKSTENVETPHVNPSLTKLEENSTVVVKSGSALTDLSVWDLCKQLDPKVLHPLDKSIKSALSEVSGEHNWDTFMEATQDWLLRAIPQEGQQFLNALKPVLKKNPKPKLRTRLYASVPASSAPSLNSIFKGIGPAGSEFMDALETSDWMICINTNERIKNR